MYMNTCVNMKYIRKKDLHIQLEMNLNMFHLVASIKKG